MNFFQKFDSGAELFPSLHLQGAKRKFSVNIGQNIPELYSVLAKVWFATSKTKLDI